MANESKQQKKLSLASSYKRVEPRQKILIHNWLMTVYASVLNTAKTVSDKDDIQFNPNKMVARGFNDGWFLNNVTEHMYI